MAPHRPKKRRSTVLQMFLIVAGVGTLYLVGFAVGRSRQTQRDDDGVEKQLQVEAKALAPRPNPKLRKRSDIAFYYGRNETTTVPSFWVPTELAHVEHGDPRVSLCRLDFDSYWRNPSKTPMFRDLMSASKCARGKSGSLNTFYDEAMKNSKPLTPSGFVFHESRVGSTLIANMLGAIPTNLVYSESAPPPAVLNHCQQCSLERKVEVLRKLVALMGNSPYHTKLFYKFQSITVPQMAPLLVAFPDTPWIFVYREPVQVMMSHFKHGVTSRNAPCLREHRRPRKETAEILQMDLASAARTTPEKYCAAHLAMLCDKALEGAERASDLKNALMLNYDSLPGSLVHYVIPEHFHITDYDDHDKLRMLDVANVYSKRRKALNPHVSSSISAVAKDVTWGGDSQEKEAAASPKIRDAADTIMRPRYDRLLLATKLQTKGNDLLHLKHMPLGLGDAPPV